MNIEDFCTAMKAYGEWLVEMCAVADTKCYNPDEDEILREFILYAGTNEVQPTGEIT